MTLTGEAPSEVWLSTRHFPKSGLEEGEIRFSPVVIYTDEETGEDIQVYWWDGKPQTPPQIDINTCTLEEWSQAVDKMVGDVLGQSLRVDREMRW